MMETEQTAGSCPAPVQTASRTWLPSNARGASRALTDTVSRFHGDGVRYKAKLIGVDPVVDAQGEKMCWDSMMKLKGFEQAARSQGKHKQRVWLKICSSGLKIVDERTGAVIHDHERSSISSLTKDESDSRALAYVYKSRDTYILFYIKTANLADPVLLDIKEVCQGVDQEALQEPAETPTQSASLLALDESSASPTEGPALKDVFSPQPDSSSGQSNQASSTSELMEVFSIKLEDSLTPTQSSPVSPPTCPPEPTLSTSQILSMFPTQPAGGSPYCSPPYSPNNMPWGQPGILGNQWAAPWPAVPGSMSAWAQPGVTAHLPGSQTQAHSMVSPQLGVTMGGNTAGFLAPPSALNGYPPPANYLSQPTGSTGGLQSASPTTDNPSLL